MKASKYNLFVRCEPDSVTLAFNTVSNGLYVFNQKDFKRAKDILEGKQAIEDSDSNIITKKLIEGRFLIDDGIDEVQMLKLSSNIYRYNPNALQMVVAPTLSCPLDCPYCYVDREKSLMSRKTINTVKKFFKKKIEKTNTAVVCWTGGEPLLALDIIDELNTYFLNECRESDKNYLCSMITNGYLLDSTARSRLKKCGINILQITLDGQKRYHDAFRFTHNGAGTYDQIMENVINASREDFEITLRSNISKDNYDGVYSLIDDLAASRIKKSNIIFSPKMVIDFKSSGKNMCNVFLNNEFSAIEPRIHLYAATKGFKFSKVMFSTSRLYCGANSLSLSVIDADANLLKCWCHLGRAENNKIGHIKENGETIFTDYNTLLKWMSWDPFEIDECTECKVLPMCMGGCMYHNIVGETDTINVGCSHRKHNLEEMLKFYYFCNTRNVDQLEEAFQKINKN